MKRMWAIAATWVLGVGCASVSTLQGAHTVGKGELRAAVEPQMLVAPDLRDLNSGAVTTASIKYGLGDKVDAFGRFGMGSTQIGTKLMLTPPQGRWAVAVAPSLAMGLPMALGTDAGVDSAWLADLPLLLDIPVNDGALVLGGKASYGLLVGTEQIAGTATTPFALAGGLVGFHAPSRGGIAVNPEVTVLVPVLGAERASLGTDIPKQGAIVALGFGLELGG